MLNFTYSLRPKRTQFNFANKQKKFPKSNIKLKLFSLRAAASSALNGSIDVLRLLQVVKEPKPIRWSVTHTK